MRKLMAIAGMISACKTCIINTITHDRYQTLTTPLYDNNDEYDMMA